MGSTKGEEDRLLMRVIAKILDETRASYATHNRKLKDLRAVRSKSQSTAQFSSAFFKTLTPLFTVQRRTASAERVVRFVSAFAATNNDELLENFFKFLLVAAVAANKTARFRACQIISEVIMRLPDDTEVSDEVWDEVIECMKVRVGDKVSVIRTFAVRSLSRFVNDSDNSDILDLFLEVLPLEQNAEVRKTIVLSLPPSNATSQAIIDCTLDVSESVRKAAYCILANKFPLQSLSIKHRTTILKRGLADRSESVSNECLKLMKDHWLTIYCNASPIELLKYLDVETYELVGDSVMTALLKDGLVKPTDGESMRDYISSADDEKGDSSQHTQRIQLMEAEVVLYWKTVCRHLQMEAQAKGSDAATTMGTEAAVYAAEASDTNDLLERILPATVSDYVDLVKTHIDAGPNYRFASRQLLLLGEMLDFSDATIRRVASAFVQDLLHRPLDYEVDEDGNKVIIGDGINLGGDKDWADAVARLARRVHAATGEFEDIMIDAVKELAQPCRERTADFMQWMHSLAVTGLLLENAKSYHLVQGKAAESAELLHSLLLPGAKHVHLDVQRVTIRCLGLFGLLENKPSEELVKQLRLSFVKGSPTIRVMASKALIDLGMWHGPQEVDKAMEENISFQPRDDKMTFSPINLSETDGDLNVELLDLLYAGVEASDWGKSLGDENESIQAVIGEGFAKILLLSEKYPSIPASLHHLLLAKLINLYFSNESKDLERLKQCLSIFFEHYASLSANHKKCLSKAFVPALRSMWPGIHGNAGGSSLVVSNKRKRAVQASKFLLQMMQAPLYAKETEVEDGNGNKNMPETSDGSEQPSLECGEEGLAIRIAAEVLSFHMKKTPAERSYVSALCRILVLLHFRLSEQGAIKLMRKLLNRVFESILTEKDLLKELKRMSECLKGLDKHADEEISQDEANLIFGRLDLDFNLDVEVAVPETPAPCSTRPTRSRRRARRDETSSDEEDSPTSVQSVIPSNPGSISTRSQRASKTAALTKLTASIIPPKIDEDDGEEDESSEVTSEDDSDGSDQFADGV